MVLWGNSLSFGLHFDYYGFRYLRGQGKGEGLIVHIILEFMRLWFWEYFDSCFMTFENYDFVIFVVFGLV